MTGRDTVSLDVLRHEVHPAPAQAMTTTTPVVMNALAKPAIKLYLMVSIRFMLMLIGLRANINIHPEKASRIVGMRHNQLHAAGVAGHISVNWFPYSGYQVRAVIQ